MFSLVGAIRRDVRGMAAIYFGLSMPLLFGLTALAFDAGRVMSLQTELQSAADAAALAGAAELDGQANAISRAQKAAGCQGSNVSGAFGVNFQSFATQGTADVKIVNCYFYNTLTLHRVPLPVDTSSDDGGATTDDTQAVYIKVVAELRSVANSFVTLVGGPQIASTTATATAGYTQVSCPATPLFICNPFELTPGTLFPDWSQYVGHEIIAVVHSHGGWAPGDFGFAQPPGAQQGSQILADYLANNSDACVTTVINPKPGADASAARDGMNVRFDIYGNLLAGPGGTGPHKNDPSYNPAYNPATDVIKGFDTTGNFCTGGNPYNNQVSPASAVATSLPDDGCFATSTCNPARIGNGSFDLSAYWHANHDPNTSAPATWTTRYKAYQDESSQPGVIPANGTATIPFNVIPVVGSPNPPNTHNESGHPQCFNDATPPAPARRLINVAIVNCIQQGVGGNNQKFVRPEAAIQTFVVRPTDQNGNNLFLEVVKQLSGTGSNGLHTIVQLYR